MEVCGADQPVASPTSWREINDNNALKEAIILVGWALMTKGERKIMHLVSHRNCLNDLFAYVLLGYWWTPSRETKAQQQLDRFTPPRYVVDITIECSNWAKQISWSTICRKVPYRKLHTVGEHRVSPKNNHRKVRGKQWCPLSKPSMWRGLTQQKSNPEGTPELNKPGSWLDPNGALCT